MSSFTSGFQQIYGCSFQVSSIVDEPTPICLIERFREVSSWELMEAFECSMNFRSFGYGGKLAIWKSCTACLRILPQETLERLRRFRSLIFLTRDEKESPERAQLQVTAVFRHVGVRSSSPDIELEGED